MTHSLKPVFISHGGGPMPLLGDEGHKEMVASLKQLAADIPKPDAIIVVSAHWEEHIATITSGPAPELIYDYRGFPKESYDIQYPCAGEPALANELFEVMRAAGMDAKLDDDRGFDHGAFVPLKIMYPEADIPCVQLSLLSSLDPSSHIEIGKALRTLSRQNVLLLGSGFSFHNLSAFFSDATADSQQKNLAFEGWLQDVCENAVYTESEREQKLINWLDAPAARFCHPREEHLLPLHVCYGAALSACEKSISIRILGKTSSMYVW